MVGMACSSQSHFKEGGNPGLRREMKMQRRDGVSGKMSRTPKLLETVALIISGKSQKKKSPVIYGHDRPGKMESFALGD